MMSDKPLVLAVTGCVSGVAHTYMAAEAIKEICRKAGYRVSVETQGALGVENEHTAEMIADSAVVVFASEVQVIAEHRFDGRRIIRTDIRTPLKSPDRLAQAIARILHLQNGFEMQL